MFDEQRSPCNGDIKWGGGRSIQTRFFSLSRKKQCHVFVCVRRVKELLLCSSGGIWFVQPSYQVLTPNPAGFFAFLSSLWRETSLPEGDSVAPEIGGLSRFLKVTFLFYFIFSID